jgi:hypothetical protein
VTLKKEMLLFMSPDNSLVAVERYTSERKAEFLLSNAVKDLDYREAGNTVLAIGLDPDFTPHRRRA